jgi:integrase
LKKKKTRWQYSNGIVYQIRNQGGAISWGIEFYDENGKRKRRIIQNAQSKKDAVLALNMQVQVEFRKEYRADSVQKEITFTEFAETYLNDYAKVNKKSWRSDFYYLNANLVPFFNNVFISKLNLHSVEKYKWKRVKDGVEKSTVNRELACLKKMMNKAIDWEFLHRNPVTGVKLFSEKDHLKERVLNPEEEKRLLKSSVDYLKPIIKVAIHSGLRRGEILNLKWKDVDLERRELIITNTKSGKARVVPVNGVLFLEFQKLWNTRVESEYVFTNSSTGKPFVDIKKAFKSAFKKANVQELRFHDLRHTFASRLVENGVDIITVKNLLGHSSVRVTERYTHSNNTQKRKAVELLACDNLSDICQISDRRRLHNNVSNWYYNN